jgi:hypothetical protein
MPSTRAASVIVRPWKYVSTSAARCSGDRVRSASATTSELATSSAWSRSARTSWTSWVSSTSGGRDRRARALSVAMLRVTVSSQPRTEPCSPVSRSA